MQLLLLLLLLLLLQGKKGTKRRLEHCKEQRFTHCTSLRQSSALYLPNRPVTAAMLLLLLLFATGAQRLLHLLQSCCCCCTAALDKEGTLNKRRKLKILSTTQNSGQKRSKRYAQRCARVNIENGSVFSLKVAQPERHKAAQKRRRSGAEAALPSAASTPLLRRFYAATIWLPEAALDKPRSPKRDH